MADRSPSHIPSWTPDAATIAHANLTRLIESEGFGSWRDLYEWSVEDPDGFWRLVVEELDIVFDTPPTGIRGSTDPENPDWLPGASYNIVTSCLDHDQDAVAIISEARGTRRVLTVAELKAEVAAFAAGFTANGFVEGDVVAIMMQMTVEAVIAYLGTIAAGGVVASIADSFASDEIATRLAIVPPVAVVTQDRATRLGHHLPMYAKCVEADAPMCVVVDTGAGSGLRDEDVTWDDFMVPGADFDPVSRPAGAHTNILFSSGTTGNPKAIPWTNTSPIKAAMDARFHQDVHRGDVVAWPTNLGWMVGPWLVYAALLNEAAIALYPDAPTTREFVHFVEDSGVTMLGLVPSIAAAWRASGALREGDWSSVRVLTSSGEASNADDYAWLMSTAGDVPMIEYCGGTELSGGYLCGIVLEPAYPSRFNAKSFGVDMVILDSDGSEAKEGEVFLVPPSMGMSTELLNGDHGEVYYDALPASDRPLRRHGDQISRDDYGLYRALGRVDDTMNLGGIKVSSADLEAAIDDLEGVAEVAAIAVPPPGGGPDRLVVFGVPTVSNLDTDALRSEIQQRIRSRLNPLFKVHEVVLIDELPRTASHKVMRRSLRAEYQA